jgi:iron(III) transport system permease protein
MRQPFPCGPVGYAFFVTVTIPGVRYGLISAAFVVFTLSVTDFGSPKVIGGDFNVLATDIYKQVIGQQNFEMGAVVSVILLIPAGLAFFVDRVVQKKQVAQVSSGAVALVPAPNKRFDNLMFAYALAVSVFVVGMLGVCQYAALVTFFPYDLSLGLKQLPVRSNGWWRLGQLL